MQTPIHCICLRIIRHSDTTSLVSAWSRERGRVTFSVPSGTGREAKRLRALMMPFSLFEGVAKITPGKEIMRISDVRPFGAGNASVMDPVKNVVSLFLSDFLSVVLRESQPDEHLSDFLFDAVELLREVNGTALANLPIYYIYKIGYFLGISPDIGTYYPGRYFDMREGIFTQSMPMHHSVLLPDDAKMIWILSRLSPRALGILRLNRMQRNQIIDGMMNYYSLHFTSLQGITSLRILRDVLG